MKGGFISKISIPFLLTAILCFNQFVLSAENSVSGEERQEEFNAGDMIMHHVMDAYDWHILTLREGTPDEKHITVYLPVILYSREQGLVTFSSSRFHEDPRHTYRGFKEDHGHIYQVDETGEVIGEASFIDFFMKGKENAFLDVSITKNVAGMLFSVFLLFLIFVPVARKYRRQGGTKAPSGFQSVLEPLIYFVRDEIAKPSIGYKYQKFMPFLLTAFFFIWLNNLMGIIPIFPFGANVTGSIAVTMVLALFTLIITSFSGNKGYWMHIIAPPGVPLWLYPILVPIEIAGVFIKPFVLMLRLFANITAGHIIILAFFSLIFIFGDLFGSAAGYGVSVVSVLFTLFMNFIELLVAFLQAYVFTLLSALYIGMAVEEHGHKPEVVP